MFLASSDFSTVASARRRGQGAAARAGGEARPLDEGGERRARAGKSCMSQGELGAMIYLMCWIKLVNMMADYSWSSFVASFVDLNLLWAMFCCVKKPA